MTDAVKEFNDVFPVLAEELLSHLRSLRIPENAIEWFERVRSPSSSPFITLASTVCLALATPTPMIFAISF